MSVKSSTIIGGKSDKHDRHEADFYQTQEECVVALMRAAPWLFRGVVWEPACGDGAISRVLAKNGVKVVSSDIRDTPFGYRGVDFLNDDPPEKFSAIVTNPPFGKTADDFIRTARSYRVPFAMFLKSSFWYTKAHLKLWDETGPAFVFPMTWRPVMAPERGNSPTMTFQWTVWNATPATDCITRPLERP